MFSCCEFYFHCYSWVFNCSLFIRFWRVLSFLLAVAASSTTVEFFWDTLYWNSGTKTLMRRWYRYLEWTLCGINSIRATARQPNLLVTSFIYIFCQDFKVPVNCSRWFHHSGVLLGYKFNLRHHQATKFASDALSLVFPFAEIHTNMTTHDQ